MNLTQKKQNRNPFQIATTTCICVLGLLLSVSASAISLSCAVSRKTHGAETYDIALDDNAVTVESRSIGTGHTIVFQFDVPVTSAGTVSVVDQNNSSISATTQISGYNVLVKLSSIADKSRATITLSGVNGSLTARASVGFLLGDIDGDFNITGKDVIGIKARAGQVVSKLGDNFKFDINATGAVNASDISIVKARPGLTQGITLPTLIQQPTSISLNSGRTAVFSAEAYGNPMPTLRWQSKTGSGDWTDISGTTSSRLLLPNVALASNGTRIRVVAQNAKGAVNSSEATLAVTTHRVINVTNPGSGKNIQPNLQVAVNSASDGDLIMLPQGEFAMGDASIPHGNNPYVRHWIYTTKAVSFKGQGIWNAANSTGTRLFRNVSEVHALSQGSYEVMLYLDVNDGGVPSNVSVSDMTLEGTKAPDPENDTEYNINQRMPDIGIRIRYATDFRIHHMEFKYFGESGVVVNHEDYIARGLIDHNIFYRNMKAPQGETRGLGLGYGVSVYARGDQPWKKSAEFGSNNFIFIEDNRFTFQRHSIAAGGGALYVARHNIIRENLIGAAIDSHEGDVCAIYASEARATRAVEIYNNSIENTLHKDERTLIATTPNMEANMLANSGIGIRGGEALVHHNTVKYFLFGGQVIMYYIPSGGGTYPIPFQTGYASGLTFGANHSGANGANGDGDLYFWANTFTKPSYYNGPNNNWYTNTEFNNGSPINSGGPYKEGRDYHVSHTPDPSGVNYSFKPGYTPYIYPHPRSMP